MTVPSREKIARAIAEKRYGRMYANSLNTETIMGHLDDAARAGFPALIGTTHEGCGPECVDGLVAQTPGYGGDGYVPCPDGRPVYWTVNDD